MATSGGDIRFTFSGDSSDLNAELSKVDNNLKEISNATTGTANGLDRNLRTAAERAAAGVDKFSKALGDVKKPVREWDQQRIPDKFDDTGDAARRASVDLNKVESAAGNTDSQLSALAGAIGHINPELASMAGMAADSAGALEGLGRMVMQNPIIAATTAAAVTALGVAFTVLTDDVEETEDAIERLTGRQDIHIARLERFTDLQDEIADRHRIEVDGIDAAVVALEQQHEEINRVSNARRRSIEEMGGGFAVRHQATLLLNVQTAALHDQVDAIYAAQTAMAEISGERPSFGIMVDRDELIRWGGTADEVFHSHVEFEERIAELREEAAERDAARTAQLSDQADILVASSNALNVLISAEQEYTLALMDEEEQIRSNAHERESALLLEMEAARGQLALVEDREAAETRAAELRTALAAATVASQAAMNAELADLNVSRVADTQSAADEMLRIAEDKAQQESEIAMELRNEQKLADIARINQTVDTAVSLTGAALEVTALMESHMAEASGKEARRFFRIRQAAAVADILMTTQQAVMRALADLGPIAGAAAGIAIGATSAAQVGTVMAEKPPAFDVGGMIRGGILSSTPDQMTASVLPGEAILNRSATERLGEGGVNALNRGGSAGGVVVVPAYRHFDRFIQDEYRKGGSFRRIVGKERQFPVGQRRY